jgi:hypothetical protein
MSKDQEVHEIVTIQDMCRLVTEENFERLIMDMADCVGFHIKLKRELSEEEYSQLKFESILWKDDGVMGMTSIMINGKELQIKKL